ncbi:MAG TPA: hypothetical protein VMT16_03285, partial [Thermoanaerobaculia bacterium]|nr:hypothetical protein [Thermoanaerobaculia bacterium]
LRAEPEPLSKVQPVAPPALDHVVARCLAKDREERWQSAKDVAVGLRWIAEAGSQAGSQAGVAAPLARRRKSRERLAWGAAALAVAIAAALAWSLTHREAAPLSGEPISFTVAPPTRADFAVEVNSHNISLSPDGTTLAAVVEQEGRSRIMVRTLGDPALRPLAGTEGAMSPFWSPDGAFLAFFADGALKKIPARGGPAQTICQVEGQNGGAWSPSGTIVFTQALTDAGGIFRVPATGGEPTRLATNDEHLAGGWPHYPSFLPDGRRVLFTRFYRPLETNVLAVVDVESGDGRALFPLMSRAAYDPASGRLLYVADGTLVARAFDLDSLSLSGDAVPLAEDVPTFVTGWSPLAVSPAGVIAYRSGRRLAALVWRGRDGSELGRSGSPGSDESFALSPDGRRAVVETEIAAKGESDLWLLDLERGTRQRLTSLSGSESTPRWSPDGREVLFINHGSVTDDHEGIHRLQVGGGGESRRLDWTNTDSWDWPLDWGPGDEMLYVRYFGEDSVDLWMASLAGEDPAPRAVVASRFRENPARLSPDGRWIAYVSDRSQPPEVFVTRVDGAETLTVSAGGGAAPRWRADGRELLYLAPEGDKVVAVTVELGDQLRLGAPRELFSAPDGLVNEGWEIAADGERFLFLEEAGDPIPVTVTVNWRARLDRAASAPRR